MNGAGKLLKIYIGESDKYHGEALYHAILRQVRDLGLAGATVVRGLEGFGAGKRIYTANIEALSFDLPVTIEVVDYEEKINELTDVVRGMVSHGVMITLQDIEIVRYTKALPESP